MSEYSWIRGVVLAAVSVALIGSGIGLLATSLADPAAVPRPAVLLLPQDGAGAVHTGYSTVTVKKPGPEERLTADREARPGR
ncbi:hypothetical protein ACFW2T_23995 [Streptomyces sp. NPDC058892]|uniref:hypothetical protein n=1 Tax=unclassified Streptomyces TaxID=2593676 RepID=UPI00044D86E0|nr:hypothetical protein [Streptomyces sp. PCS3-D2]WKV75340.1 hypothetical protein AW27_029715 [Streptomyces sp. PCS3-D2]